MSHSKRAIASIKKGIVAIVGGILLLVGIVAIPYPGPGWLIVFAALAILATEFDWAQALLDRAKTKYDEWQSWVEAQTLWLRILLWSATAVVVVLTIWLLNGYGYLSDIFRLGFDWARSPIPWFY